MDKDGETAQKLMFLGTYLSYFTGKNRIVLPKRFRKELGGDKFYIIKGLDGEIWGLSSKEWHKEAENRLRIPIEEVRGRVLRRKFFSESEECFLDSQGRFIVPKELLEYAVIKNEILLVGAGDHFEIWNPESWQEIAKKLEKT